MRVPPSGWSRGWTGSDPVDRDQSHVGAGQVDRVGMRVPVLGALFSDAGGRGEAGRGRPVRRASGLEPHGVREYVEGEPLRAVHWPSSARRGRLMVRELEDAPRDGVAVVLDVERSAVAGPPGDTSLDDAVRAAAGLVRAHGARGREALLVVATLSPDVHRVRTLGPDWERALDALAAVEAADGSALPALVGPRGPLATLPEIVWEASFGIYLVARGFRDVPSAGRESAAPIADGRSAAALA